MMTVDLAAEFDLAYRKRSQEHRQHLAEAGISFQAMLRAGDLGVERINASGRLYMPSPTGFPAVILAIWSPGPPSIYCAVEDPEIVDLVALRTDDPGRWWYRIGENDVDLGADHLDLAHTAGWPISFATTPLDWLRGDCRGACLLDRCEARWSAERYAEDDDALADWWRAAS